MDTQTEHGRLFGMRNVTHGEYYLAKEVDREIRRLWNILYSYGYSEPAEGEAYVEISPEIHRT